eukprot:9575616-Alexandrium_andersonii.AAC.1
MAAREVGLHSHTLRCHGRHGQCSFRPGRKRVHLEGRLTTRAAAYPHRMNTLLAQRLLGE